MLEVAREYVLHSFAKPVSLQIDYAKELNPQQLAAVTAPPGPALVIAGAGSGKTRTLIYRVAYLLEQGIPADRILLLTFTNKAAREMMRRIHDLLGMDLLQLMGGTFHSIAARLLRPHAELLGYRRDFTILDREDSHDLIKACLGEPEFETQTKVFPKPDVLLGILSMAVNKHTSIAEAVAVEYPAFVDLTPKLILLAQRFQERKRQANVMDFDDLLTQWLRLLETQPALLEKYQRQFQFLLVDEYQDTNTVQGRIVDLLGGRHKNVMVVGDDSQSIYSWRGANFRNIIDFPKRYPNTTVYKIETNYRSTPEILSLANAAIAPNREQFEKQLTSARPSGIKPVVVPCGDASVQAAFICQRVIELHEEGVSLKDVAILYRSHFHAMELQLELTRRQIPFLITSGVRFFEQAHIKDLTAFLRLIANPSDELAFKRLVQLLPGIGNKAAEKLWRLFSQKLSSVAPSPVVPSTEPSVATEPSPAASLGIRIAEELQRCRAAVPKKADKAWAELSITFAQLEPLHGKPGAMIQLIVDAFYGDYLTQNFENYRVRQEDVEQLGIFANGFEDLETFLTQLSLLTNVEAEDNASKDGNEDRVRLTTIHQAKGLEYDVVFVIMLCDGLFPSSWSLENPEGEEEERRLFYVSITRARNELYLTYPLLRFTQGEGAALQTASRFIGELPEALYEEWSLRQNSFGR